jgi:2-polyprenyl-3-methyl-5-hydroxy-6-metoxy-1,4-benzoquinol methylase
MGVRRKQYDRDYYETPAYREIPNSRRNRNRLQEILAYKQGGKLFEIGCGKGGFLKLAERTFDVEGMDISKHAIASIKLFLRKKVRRGNIEEENLASDHYDVIVVFNVLEHLRQPGKVIEKIYHGLTKGGIFIGSVPHNSGLIGRAHTALTNLFDRTHCSTYPPHHWRASFRETGFRKIHFFGEVMLGRNFSLYIRNKFWKYVSFNLMFLCKK